MWKTVADLMNYLRTEHVELVHDAGDGWEQAVVWDIEGKLFMSSTLDELMSAYRKEDRDKRKNKAA